MLLAAVLSPWLLHAMCPTTCPTLPADPGPIVTPSLSPEAIAASGRALPPVIFAKTTKTGGSIVANVLHRIADARNLTAMVHPRAACTIALPFALGWPGPFPGPCFRSDSPRTFDMILPHAIFQPELMRPFLNMARSGKEPLVITILRDPGMQAQSSYNFYTKYNGGASPEQYVRNVGAYTTLRHPPSRGLQRNPQAFMLGWYVNAGRSASTARDAHPAKIREWLVELDAKVDLALVTDRLFEGLALLRARLSSPRGPGKAAAAIGIDEMVTVRLKEMRAVRAAQGRRVAPFTQGQLETMRRVNNVDMSLFDYFAEAFAQRWSKAIRQTPQLQHDAAEIERLSREVTEACGFRPELNLSGLALPAQFESRLHELVASSPPRCPAAMRVDAIPYSSHLAIRTAARCATAMEWAACSATMRARGFAAIAGLGGLAPGAGFRD